MPLNYELRERVLGNDIVRAWISKRAYELHQSGSYRHGQAIEDWMNAESELLALASVFEEIFRSKSAPRQAITKRRDSKTRPKSPRHRRSGSASPSEVLPIADKKLNQGSRAKPDEPKKTRKAR